MSGPFDDASRRVSLSARMETPDFIREEMNRMMRELIESLPEDSPERRFWNALPKAPGWDPFSENGYDE